MNRADELIMRVLDGRATGAEAGEFQEILRRDAAMRRRYWGHVSLGWMLESHFHGGTLSVPEKSHLHRGIRGRFSLALAAALVLGLSAWLASVWLRPPAVYEVANRSLHEVALPGGGISHDRKLRAGSRLHLAQGQAEIRFKGGTKAVVLGPAELRIDSAKAVALLRGDAWFHVSEKDYGFRVITPQLKLIDHGTDFGVSVSLIDPDQIHVFSGEVEAAPREGGKSDRLLTGMARQAAPAGGLRTIGLDSGTFSRSLAPGLPYLRYTFDSVENGHFLSAGTHPAAGTEKTALAGRGGYSLVPGVSGNALRLDGKSGIAVSQWPGISGISPRTVSYWLRIPPTGDFRRNPSLVGWGDSRIPLGKWKTLLVQNEQGGAAHPRISFGEYGYDALVPVNDGRWHHLAFTYTGARGADGHPEVSIHVDGIRRALAFQNFAEKTTAEGLHPQTRKLPETFEGGNSRPLGIGASIDDAPKSFSGEIDELKIHAGVLSDEEIGTEAEQAAKLPS